MEKTLEIILVNAFCLLLAYVFSLIQTDLNFLILVGFFILSSDLMLIKKSIDKKEESK